MKWVLRWELSHFDWKWCYRSVLVIMLSEGAGIDRKRQKERKRKTHFDLLWTWWDELKEIKCVCEWVCVRVCVCIQGNGHCAVHGSWSWGLNVTVILDGLQISCDVYFLWRAEIISHLHRGISSDPYTVTVLKRFKGCIRANWAKVNRVRIWDLQKTE